MREARAVAQQAASVPVSPAAPPAGVVASASTDVVFLAILTTVRAVGHPRPGVGGPVVAPAVPSACAAPPATVDAASSAPSVVARPRGRPRKLPA